MKGGNGLLVCFAGEKTSQGWERRGKSKGSERGDALFTGTVKEVRKHLLSTISRKKFIAEGGDNRGIVTKEPAAVRRNRVWRKCKGGVLSLKKKGERGFLWELGKGRLWWLSEGEAHTRGWEKKPARGGEDLSDRSERGERFKFFVEG